MSDTANPGAQGTPQAGAQPGNDGGTAIPKARFDEVIGERNSLRERLAALEAESEQRRKADLEAKGQYDQLKAEYEQRIAALEPRTTTSPSPMVCRLTGWRSWPSGSRRNRNRPSTRASRAARGVPGWRPLTRSGRTSETPSGARPTSTDCDGPRLRD